MTVELCYWFLFPFCLDGSNMRLVCAQVPLVMWPTESRPSSRHCLVYRLSVSKTNWCGTSPSNWVSWLVVMVVLSYFQVTWPKSCFIFQVTCPKFCYKQSVLFLVSITTPFNDRSQSGLNIIDLSCHQLLQLLLGTFVTVWYIGRLCQCQGIQV